MDNIPSLLGNNGSRKTKPPRGVEATVLSLKTTQNLEVVRANAADSDVQAMEAMEVSTLCGLCNIAFAQERAILAQEIVLSLPS